MKSSTLVYAALIVTLMLYFLLFSGCEMLRKAPTEAQKQTAQLGVNATEQIRYGGAEPQSAVSVIAHESAKANQIYFGPPKEPPAPPDTVIPQAQADAAERPDPWDVADGFLGLGASVALVFGGAAGTKAAALFKTARQKSKALRQIIVAQEDYRNELKTAAASDSDHAANAAEMLESLKSKNDRFQTASTMSIVAEVKNDLKKAPAA